MRGQKLTSVKDRERVLETGWRENNLVQPLFSYSTPNAQLSRLHELLIRKHEGDYFPLAPQMVCFLILLPLCYLLIYLCHITQIFDLEQKGVRFREEKPDSQKQWEEEELLRLSASTTTSDAGGEHRAVPIRKRRRAATSISGTKQKDDGSENNDDVHQTKPKKRKKDAIASDAIHIEDFKDFQF